MSMTLADRELFQAPAPHRWHVDDYFRASDAGAFNSQRVELIQGELIDMPSQKDPHAWAISRLVRELVRLFPDPYWIKIRATLGLNDSSAPEPDVAVMSGPPTLPPLDPPTPLLVIEVSETTLLYDRGDKASHYAANGITEYWVANVLARQLEVYREPHSDSLKRYGWGYRDVQFLDLKSSVVPLCKPEASLAIASFLG